MPKKLDKSSPKKKAKTFVFYYAVWYHGTVVPTRVITLVFMMILTDVFVVW